MSEASVDEGDDHDLLTLRSGLKAYDAEGNLLGTVESIDRSLGTMSVVTNPFFEEALEVSLQLITVVNAHELFLICRREALQRNGTALK